MLNQSLASCRATGHNHEPQGHGPGDGGLEGRRYHVLPGDGARTVDPRSGMGTLRCSSASRAVALHLVKRIALTGESTVTLQIE